MASEGGDSEEESQQFGDFTLLSKIGEGSSAEVFLARQNSLGVKVALKRWRRPLGDADRAAFLQECRLQQQLSSHPNIVRIRWAEAQDSQPPWIAMDLYEMSLQQRLQDPDPIPPADAFRWADEILAGLAAVHEADHVHRDVKTANVLFADGIAALGDLGISMRVDASTSHSAAGTAGFVAPELATNAVPTFRTDVYSAAVTLRALFGDQVPDSVEALLTRASSHDPNDRPADAGEFRRKLAALRPAETGARRSQSQVLPVLRSEPQPRRSASRARSVRRRRRRLLIIPVVAATVAGIVVAGLTVLRTSGLEGTLDDGVSVSAASSSAIPVAISTPATSAKPVTESGTPTMTTTKPIPTGRPSPSKKMVAHPSPSPAITSETEKPVATATTDASAEPKPTKTSKSKLPASEPDDSDCYETAEEEVHLSLEADVPLARGPHYTSASCPELRIKLTSATYRTRARACFEEPDETITECSKWTLLSYPDTWDTLVPSVPADSRWELQLLAEGDEDIVFFYTQ